MPHRFVSPERLEPRAVLVVFAVAVAFAALVGLGRLLGRMFDRTGNARGALGLPFNLAAGWALAAAVSAAAAAFGADQDWLARLLLAVGLVALLPTRLRQQGAASEDLRLLGSLAFAVALALPLAFLAAREPALMFDEFAQWLPNARYLVEHGHYGSFPDWAQATNKPGYPNAGALIALLASEIAGPSVEAPFKVFVVFTAASFGALFAFVVDGGRRAGVVALTALGALLALANPFFDPRIALTALADAPTGIVLAIAAVAAAAGIGAARAGRPSAASGWFGWSGAACAALVLLRSTNVVLVAALGVACLVAHRVRRPRAERRPFLWAASLLGPPIAAFLLWQAWLHAAAIGADMTVRPLAAWDWSAPFAVARALFVERLLDNPLIGGAAISLGVAALVGAFHLMPRFAAGDGAPVPPGVLMAMVAIVGASFIAFLAFAYIGVFSAREAAEAVSLWRYLTELGPLLLVGLAAVLASARRAAPSPRLVLGAGIVAAALTLLLPVLGRGYYALDCRYPDMVAARMATRALAPALAPFAPSAAKERRLAIVHPTMADWMAHAAAYDLRWPIVARSIAFRTGPADARGAQSWAWDTGADALLDLSALDRDRLTASGRIPAIALTARPADPAAEWTQIATTEPRPLPPCGGTSAMD